MTVKRRMANWVRPFLQAGVLFAGMPAALFSGKTLAFKPGWGIPFLLLPVIVQAPVLASTFTDTSCGTRSRQLRRGNSLRRRPEANAHA